MIPTAIVDEKYLSIGSQVLLYADDLSGLLEIPRQVSVRELCGDRVKLLECYFEYLIALPSLLSKTADCLFKYIDILLICERVYGIILS